jgi:hypothetical protein
VVIVWCSPTYLVEMQVSASEEYQSLSMIDIESIRAVQDINGFEVELAGSPKKGRHPSDFPRASIG